MARSSAHSFVSFFCGCFLLLKGLAMYPKTAIRMPFVWTSLQKILTQDQERRVYYISNLCSSGN